MEYYAFFLPNEISNAFANFPEVSVGILIRNALNIQITLEKIDIFTIMKTLTQ